MNAHRTVVLVDLPWMRDKDPRIPLGQASIAASLRAAGVATRLVTVPVNAPATTASHVRARVIEACSGLSPETVDIAIGAYVWNEHLVRDLLAQLRRRGVGRLIVGGPQVSYSPHGVAALYPEADAVVRGAGEAAMVALTRTIDRRPVAGVVWAGMEDRAEQASVGFDALPSPFLTGVVPVRRGAFLRWETQRGCRFACSFCQHREPDARLRGTLDSERIAAEIALFSRRGVADIAVLDPIFNSGPRAARVLQEFQHHRFEGRLSLQCRAEMIDDEFLDAVGALNARLEFGLQTSHPAEGRAVLRANNMPKVDSAIERVRAREIEFEVSLIFGLPTQTLTSFRESVAHCLDLGVPTIKAFPLMLLRGTKLERDRRRWGLVENSEQIPAVVSSTTFDERDWRQMAALSEALRQTEGDHPPMTDLLRLADRLLPEPARFSPRAVAGDWS